MTDPEETLLEFCKENILRLRRAIGDNITIVFIALLERRKWCEENVGLDKGFFDFRIDEMSELTGLSYYRQYLGINILYRQYIIDYDLESFKGHKTHPEQYRWLKSMLTVYIVSSFGSFSP